MIVVKRKTFISVFTHRYSKENIDISMATETPSISRNHVETLQSVHATVYRKWRRHVKTIAQLLFSP